MTRLPRIGHLRAAGAAIRIAAFGSSTTAGYGASDPATRSYPACMEAALRQYLPSGVTVANFGVSGENIDGMARRFGDVVAGRPDLVILQAGSNDAAQGITLAHFAAMMSVGLAVFRAARADILLMEPQWSRVLEAQALFPSFLDAVRALGAREEIPVFPRYTLMQRWATETGLGIGGLSPDGMHMEDVGYGLLGTAVARFILDLSGGTEAGPPT